MLQLRRAPILILISLMIVAGLAAFFSQKSPEVSEDDVPADDAAQSGVSVHQSPDNFEFEEESRLLDVAGGLSVGLATKRMIGSEVFIIVAAQLDQPRKNYFYQTWIARRIGDETEAISLGKMEQSSDTAIWQTVFRAASLPSPDYGEIWVTLEREDDNSPERLILKGKF